MRYFVDIKLPIKNTMKVIADDLTMMDYLFDMKIPDMSKLLDLLHEQDIPSMALLVSADMGFVGIFFYRPPEVFWDFEDQMYQMYLAPNYTLLHHYWVDKRMRTHDMYEVHTITKVVDYLEDHMRTKKCQSVSHT